MRLTTQMCLPLGMNVVCAGNVREGYQASKQRSFDFALVDLQLPEQDGLLLLNKWQAEKQVEPQRVFIFTAFDSEVMREKLAHFQQYPVINKPILLNSLYEKLSQPFESQEVAVGRWTAESDSSITAEVGEQDNVEGESKGSEKQYEMSVLLVENNDINRIVATEMLGELPINLDIADNGEIAIAKLAKGSFDLVLMDIQMPVMDGIQTTKHLRCFDMPQSYSNMNGIFTCPVLETGHKIHRSARTYLLR